MLTGGTPVRNQLMHATIDKSKKQTSKQTCKQTNKKKRLKKEESLYDADEKKGPLVHPYIPEGPSAAGQEVHATGLEICMKWRQEVIHKIQRIVKAVKHPTNS